MKLVSDPGRCGGEVTLNGTRLTVSTIWAYGGDVDRFMREFPDENREDIEKVMAMVEFKDWDG